MATKIETNTIGQIQRDVGEIKVSIARVEENLKNSAQDRIEIANRLKAAEVKNEKCDDDFNSRITKLEEWQWKAIGIATAIFTVITMGVQYLLR